MLLIASDARPSGGKAGQTGLGRLDRQHDGRASIRLDPSGLQFLVHLKEILGRRFASAHVSGRTCESLALGGVNLTGPASHCGRSATAGTRGGVDGTRHRCGVLNSKTLVGGPGFEPGASRSRTLHRSCPRVSRRFLQCPSVLNFEAVVSLCVLPCPPGPRMRDTSVTRFGATDGQESDS